MINQATLKRVLNGSEVIAFLLALVLCLTLTSAHAQFAQPLPQPSVYCNDYNVRNNTNYKVSIKFDNLDDQIYDLEPGQEATYHKTKYCSAPAYVVANYSGGGRAGTIGRNIALDYKHRDSEVVESGRYIFLKPVGEAIPPGFQ
jgi:hypothetical protein